MDNNEDPNLLKKLFKIRKIQDSFVSYKNRKLLQIDIQRTKSFPQKNYPK